jgi:altronate dehydratase
MRAFGLRDHRAPIPTRELGAVHGRIAARDRGFQELVVGMQCGGSANTTPGNKKGGLSNIVEKAMGSIV